MKRLIGGMVVALTLAAALSVRAQGPSSAQIQTALQVFVQQVHTWTALQTFLGGAALTGPQTITTTTQTSSNPSADVYAGFTAPVTTYAADLVHTSLTSTGGIVRGAGVLSYYLYAPTTTDVSGVNRMAVFGYTQTGGTQPIGSDVYGVLGRALHLGTGAATNEIAGGGFNAFDGHAGAQGSTGGAVASLIGAKAQSFAQTTLGTVDNQYGLVARAEHDYGTVTNAYGIWATVMGGATPTTSYGLYVDTVKGTTKYSIYAADATAPSYFAGNVETKSVRGTAVLFANVPSPAVEGMLVAVTDSMTATWGATITGMGSNHVLAYYNGTNWTVAGK